jgi:fumarylpyruvate hydrolase
MRLSFDLQVPTAPIDGGATVLPIRRIYCVGRNYADHAREMGGTGREPPFFFAKPADAVVPVAKGAQGRIAYPPRTGNLNHEVELVVAIGLAGRCISADQALNHALGYAVGIDLTRRDVQAELKRKAQPWEMAKAFDQSAPIGPICLATTCGHLQRGAIWLSVNGSDRQRGELADMIWSVPEVIAELSTYVELRPGDLIFTGTPSGVGVLERGDHVSAGIAGLSDLQLLVD